MKASNHLQELTLPQHQLIRVETERERKMGSRVKDLIFLSIIILLGISVWSSYRRENRVPEEEWPWSPQLGHGIDLEEDLLQIDGHADSGDYDHLNINGHDGLRAAYDDGHETDFDIHDAFNVDTESELAEQSPHLPLQEDIVHGENHDVESNEDQIELHVQGQSPLLNQQLQLAGSVPSVQLPGQPESPESAASEQQIGAFGQLPANMVPAQPSTDDKVVSIAKQVLENHASIQDQSLDNTGVAISETNVQTNDNPTSSDSIIHTFSTEDKPRPMLVFRSHVVRDVAGEDSTKPKIPRIIHQSWESSDIPMNFAQWVSSWLEKNPGWEYWFWTPADVQALIEKSYPQYASTFRPDVSLENRANIMRYFIIHAHGGVYAELDMECLTNIDTWIFSHGCFLAEEAREHSYLVHNMLTGSVINAIMACRPHHPFYEVILHALPDYIARYPSDTKRASGSFFLDEIFRAFKKHPLPSSLAQYGDVALIEPDYFIPSYDQKHWSAIDKACNSNIGDMPFHVSWLCTLWIRKRMQENQPYKHSYTDHHWIDIDEIGSGNIATIPITVVIQSVIAGGSFSNVQPKPEGPSISNPSDLIKPETDNALPSDTYFQTNLIQDTHVLPGPNYPDLSSSRVDIQGTVDSNTPNEDRASVQVPGSLPGAPASMIGGPLLPQAPPQFPSNTMAGDVNAPAPNLQGLVHPPAPPPQQYSPLIPPVPSNLDNQTPQQPQQQQLGGVLPQSNVLGVVPQTAGDSQQLYPAGPPSVPQLPALNVPQQYP